MKGKTTEELLDHVEKITLSEFLPRPVYCSEIIKGFGEREGKRRKHEKKIKLGENITFSSKKS